MTMTNDVRRLAFRAAIAAVTAAVLVEATVMALLLESLRRYGLFETPQAEGGDPENRVRASCPTNPTQRRR
jgi:hypothetical protein